MSFSALFSFFSEKIALHYTLALSYLGLLLLVVWTTVDVNYNSVDYRAFIVQEKDKFNALAGIVLGIGFFPMTIFLLYHFCLSQPNTKQRILIVTPLVVFLILGVSLIPILYEFEIEKIFSQLGITNDENPAASDQSTAQRGSSQQKQSCNIYPPT